MTRMLCIGAAVLMAMVAVPAVSKAQHHDLTHRGPADENALVGFGVLPVGNSLGPEPLCLVIGNIYTFPGAPPNGGTRAAVAADIGGPNDPCSYKNHLLTPEEVTIFKDGQVTLQVHGGGHAPAIYEVSKDTTRDDIGKYLCPDFDRALPAQLHPCRTGVGGTQPPPGTANAAAAHDIADGKGDVVIVAAAADASPTGNRVWSEPGRLMAAGGIQFANGGTTATNGELIAYRFLKTGRYLVICMNRSHFLNDWMFGFVNVVGGN